VGNTAGTQLCMVSLYFTSGSVDSLHYMFVLGFARSCMPHLSGDQMLGEYSAGAAVHVSELDQVWTWHPCTFLMFSHRLLHNSERLSCKPEAGANRSLAITTNSCNCDMTFGVAIVYNIVFRV
jgi:hypothetical protein